jgi:membrane-associated phospholipid phosphatase
MEIVIDKVYGRTNNSTTFLERIHLKKNHIFNSGILPSSTSQFKNNLMLKFKLFFILFSIFSYINCYAQYQLNNEPDYPLIGTAVMLGAGTYLLNSYVQPLDSNDISMMNKNDIFLVDRSLMADYHSDIAGISDYILTLNMSLPLTLLFDKNVNNEPLKYGLMYFETIAITASVTGLVKNYVTRTRPFVYGINAGIDLKMDKDARQSYFSGHSSWSFSSAVFISSIYTKLNPNSEYRSLVWGSTLLLAATTGVLRIASGKHFFTDVVTGAIVGSFMGWFIPYLHENELKESNNIEYTKYIKIFEMKYGVY